MLCEGDIEDRLLGCDTGRDKRLWEGRNLGDRDLVRNTHRVEGKPRAHARVHAHGSNTNLDSTCRDKKYPCYCRVRGNRVHDSKDRAEERKGMGHDTQARNKYHEGMDKGTVVHLLWG